MIECSNDAYYKLQAIGIEERTKRVKEELTQIFLYKTIWDGEANIILEQARTAKPSEEQQDILALEEKLDDFVFQINPYVIEHPFLVAKVVLGDDLDKFSQYGFSSKKNLASAINAYCIGEKKTINDDKRSYIWRQGKYKNSVNLIDHGDMHANQKNLSKIEESGVLIDPPGSGFGLQQDWSPFLISILKYAQAIGKKDIPEIKDWQEMIRELRQSNPWGNTYSEKFTKTKFDLTIQYDHDLSGAKDINLKLWINKSVLPYFNKGALDILKNTEDGDLKIRLYTQHEKFKRIAHYIPEDIPHLLKANYQLYARSVDDLANIMYWFNK